MDGGPDLDLWTLRSAYRSGALTPVALVERLAERLDEPVEGVPDPPPQPAGAAGRRARSRGALSCRGTAAPLRGTVRGQGRHGRRRVGATAPPARRFSNTATATATVVGKLLAAGAILVGKTNLGPLATGLTSVASPTGSRATPSTRASSSADRTGVGGGGRARPGELCPRRRHGWLWPGAGRVHEHRRAQAQPGVVERRRRGPALPEPRLRRGAGQEHRGGGRNRRPGPGLQSGRPASRPEADHFRFAPPAPPARFRLRGPCPDRPGVLRRRRIGTPVRRGHLSPRGGRRRAGGDLPFAPLREAAGLLYGGPWAAERLPPSRSCSPASPAWCSRSSVRPSRRAAAFTGTEVFRALHRLEALRQEVRGLWQALDLLLVPTTPTIYSIDAIADDPLRLNAARDLHQLREPARSGRRRGPGRPSPRWPARGSLAGRPAGQRRPGCWPWAAACTAAPAAPSATPVPVSRRASLAAFRRERPPWWPGRAGPL